MTDKMMYAVIHLGGDNFDNYLIGIFDSPAYARAAKLKYLNAFDVTEDEWDVFIIPCEINKYEVNRYIDYNSDIS